MTVRMAKGMELPWLSSKDRRISGRALAESLAAGRILVAEEENGLIGWLRYNLFWDSIPFLNMLFVREGARGRGVGTALVRQWETRMKEAGFSQVLTSAASDGTARQFFRKLGYEDVGSFAVPGEPPERMLRKSLE